MLQVTIHDNGTTTTITAEEGITLLELLNKNGFSVDSPCNGKGICGKCRVLIQQGKPPYTKEEKELLTLEELQKGIYLSCMCKVTEDMEITLFQHKKNAFIQTDTTLSKITGIPVISKHFLSLPTPSITDQIPDDERVINAFLQKLPERKNTCHTDSSSEYLFGQIPIHILYSLPEKLRQNAFQATVINFLGQAVGVESGNTSKNLYGVAIDMGTTTLAAYLYDLRDKTQLTVVSLLNPQKKYGADVISRIDYASKSDEHRLEMAGLIRKTVGLLIEKLSSRSQITPTDIYLVTVAGNTTMLHLLMGLPALHIATSPFVPVTLSGQVLNPGEMDCPINAAGRVIVLPSVSAYIGSDTVAAVLSVGMHKKREMALLVDIGTNGEIVLGNSNSLFACSTAAGPAFEGANIRCGSGGIDGAINSVQVTPKQELQINTIGNHKAIGICGSGLIDAIACMLKLGVFDETGRFVEEEELPERTSFYKDRLVEINRQPAFVLVPADETAHGEPIVITQKDVREVQNAKAAIAAGIQVLARKAGYTIQQIQAVYLAGGFGNFMRIESALTIGLLPKEVAGKTYAIGNAAGAGAIHTLLSREALTQTNDIAKKIQYLELSSNPDFVAEYTDSMFF